MIDNPVSSLFKQTHQKKILNVIPKKTKSISIIDNDNYNNNKKSRNSFKLSTYGKSSSISLFKVTKDNHYSNASRVNYGIAKNSISYYDRGILKKDIQKQNTNSISTYSNSISVKPRSGSLRNHLEFNNNNNNDNNRHSIFKTQRQLSLSRLINTKFSDILPPRIKYSAYNMASSNDRNINRNRKTIQCNSSSKESFDNRFQTMKVSLKNLIKSEPFIKKLLNINNNTTKNLRLLCRLKLMKWLWKKKSYLVEKMISSYSNYKWFFNKYELLDKKTFKELMLLLELGKDSEFVDQLYLILGQNKDKTVNIKECLFFFIFTCNNSSYEKKISMLLDVVEDKTTLNTIHITYMINYLRAIIGKKDYCLCRAIFDKITRRETMKKKELFDRLGKNEAMKRLFDKYAMTLINIDTRMNDELDIILSINMGELLYDL